jgi:glycosyltransferase involved in cell wall biosynthesis
MMTDPKHEQAPTLSVVVPTYRGARSLPELVHELAAAIEPTGLSYEVVLVNDSSPDDTWDVITELAAQDPRVRGIDLLHNHGQPTATMCGLAAARGSLVATMDDDLEHPPHELPTLLAALAEHPDWDAVVATWPVNRSWFRDLGTRVYALADRIAWGTPVGFRHTAFRLMRRPVCDALVAHETRLPVVGPMLHRVSSRVRNVEVRHGARRYGSSGFSVWAGLRRLTVNFKSGSTAPLAWLSGFGLALAFAAFVVGAGLLVRWAFGASSPAGWLSVMLAVVFVGGTNLLALGILGSYVDLLVREARRPPRWSIRRTAGDDPGADRAE